jgi:hypothetical protein
MSGVAVGAEVGVALATGVGGELDPPPQAANNSVDTATAALGSGLRF